MSGDARPRNAAEAKQLALARERLAAAGPPPPGVTVELGFRDDDAHLDDIAANDAAAPKRCCFA